MLPATPAKAFGPALSIMSAFSNEQGLLLSLNLFCYSYFHDLYVPERKKNTSKTESNFKVKNFENNCTEITAIKAI